MSRIVDESGRSIKEEVPIPEPGKVETNQEGHLGSIEVDGKKVKIINSVTMIEIIVHKLENGKEIQQVVAHDFMMVEHKPYMIRLLTDAINTVMKATNKKQGLIKAVSTVVAQKLGIMNRKDLRNYAKSERW